VGSATGLLEEKKVTAWRASVPTADSLQKAKAAPQVSLQAQNPPRSTLIDHVLWCGPLLGFHPGEAVPSPEQHGSLAPARTRGC